MRRLLATVLAALAIGFMLAAISLPKVPRATARPLDPAQATPTPPVSACVPAFNKVAAPINVRLGDEVTITLTAKAVCPTTPLHVVLVLPASSGLSNDVREQIMDNAENVVRDLKLAEHPNDKVGIVSYAGTARTLCELTNDTERLVRCIHQLEPALLNAMDAGLKEGLKVLQKGRPRGASGDEVQEVMVLYAGSGNTAGCAPVLSAANQVKSQKVLLMTVCAGADCDGACLRQAASSARYFFQVDDFELDPRPGEGTGPNLRRLTITDKLPDDMLYVQDSANPPATTIDPTRGLIWTVANPPPGGITITFRVKPQEAGERPTNVEATGELTDAAGLPGYFVFPVPVVNVQAVPTDTPSPTPTAAMTCTRPACPCGYVGSGCNVSCIPCTPTPTATMTPVPRPIYLTWLECWR